MCCFWPAALIKTTVWLQFLPFVCSDCRLCKLFCVSNQVDYDNHPLYKHGKTGRKQSPVRLFTNISPRDIILPKEEGYRYQHTLSTANATSTHEGWVQCFYFKTCKICSYQSRFLSQHVIHGPFMVSSVINKPSCLLFAKLDVQLKTDGSYSFLEIYNILAMIIYNIITCPHCTGPGF